MGTSTFSGPIKAGTIKETTGTSLGTNIKNTGQVVMAQSFTTGSLAGGASGPNTTDVVIGDTVGGAATIINQFSITTGSGAGRKYPTTEAGGALTWAETSNTADIRLTWTTTGATNAGEIRVTVLYQQASNLVA